MQKKTTVLTAILGLALVAVVSAGATLAYLTDYDSTETVTYSVGFLDISLSEPLWDAGNAAQPGLFNTDGNAIIKPGTSVLKDPQITVAQGSVDCYVRLHVRIHKDLARVIVSPPKPHGDWVVEPISNPVGEYLEWYYYYPKIMKAGNVTPSAFENVSYLPVSAVPDDSTESAFYGKASEQSILVVGQAVQASGFETVGYKNAPWSDPSAVWSTN